MRIYIAHSYKHRHELKEVIDSLVATCKDEGYTPFVFTREYDDYGPDEHQQMMTDACKEMDSSDVLIAEVSTKEIGVGLEVGYFAAQKKPIIYIRHDTAKISTTVAGVSSQVITYTSAEDLSSSIKQNLSEL